MALVLVAEDEPCLAEVLTEVLMLEGHKAETVPTGAQALKRLRQDPKPDLLVVDLFMPVLGGKALLELMQHDAELNKIPVIISTGAVLGPDTLPPPNTYKALLAKPFDLIDFCKTVSDLV